LRLAAPCTSLEARPLVRLRRRSGGAPRAASAEARLRRDLPLRLDTARQARARSRRRVLALRAV